MARYLHQVINSKGNPDDIRYVLDEIDKKFNN